MEKENKKINIVVLDGRTLNPGDLSWEPIEKSGNLMAYDRTEPGLVIERSINADVILTNKTLITRDDIAVLPRLKYIGVLATGYNVVDTEAASEAGVVVTNIPAYSTMSVAQQIFSLILTITNHSEYYAEQNRLGRWSLNEDFCYTDYPMMELDGKHLGIVGYGHIGQATACVAKAFGMEVSVVSSKKAEDIPEVRKGDLHDIFSNCDIICLCCPLTADNAGMVNKDLLAVMKKTAILINTARGGLVNDRDLADALNAGCIYAAGMDVLCKEPPESDNPLLHARNCYVTPHIAWASREARLRLMDIAADNLRAFLDGNPVNVVNPN